MKSRWLLITLLLAFPFAFAFFLTEARLGQQRTARRVLVIPPPPAATTAVESAPDISPSGPISPIGPISENPTPSTAPVAVTPPPSIVPSEATGSTNRESKIENSATLLEGTVTKESDALVYESDAKLQLPNNLFLSSPTGVMVSDEQQKIFAGDMQLLSTKQTISANEAVLTLQPDGGSVLTSKTLSIAANDNSTPAMELKGDNLTLTIPASKKSAVPASETLTATASPTTSTP
ncbi:hypothetical protein CMV30_00200 [Nibricoccus aquaticus]|uniref:Uncharacterized protein n=1 Tax=Nibricoccus aquaticus TaxID=2576891 RepID=A0A290Q5S7_9BACT|nr:hypothetical protein [Nibricoccus aquaticus]ATC62520.1 hypothetical protein CMV30_00200 [Nibricoccus aquaticus]